MRPETTAIHTGSVGADGSGASAVPIYQTASYAYATAAELASVFGGTAPGYVYTRIANPTTTALEATLSELENGIGCIAAASGMAAIASVVMGLLRAGDELVAAVGMFGGTISLFENMLRRFDITTHLVEPGDTDGFAAAVNEKTRLIFLETILNPRMDVPDLTAVAAIAHRVNIPLIVDNTVTTPFLIRPGEYGADVVVHSTSKFINGHGTAIGGAIIDTGNYDWASGAFPDIRKLSKNAGRLAFLSHLRRFVCCDLGGCPAPMNSFLMLQGVQTLSMRMARHCDNALSLARFLQNHPLVQWVQYPALTDSPFFERTVRQFGGRGGGLLAFSLGSAERAFRFIAAVRLAKNLANLGDAKTLVIHPSSTIFREFEPDQQRRMGIGPDTIRVSVGLEDFDDIREDFQQAIDRTGRI